MLDTVQPEQQNKTNDPKQHGKEKTYQKEDNAGQRAARVAEQKNDPKH